MTMSSLSMPSIDTQAAVQPNLYKMKSAKGMTIEKINATAQDFEAQFISEMMGSMFSTIDPKNSFGGSEAEDTYRSLMVNEYGKTIARAGGLGIAQQIKQSMLKMQEVS